MSHSIDECYGFYRVELRAARKAHSCDACGEPIAPRARYYVVRWEFDGKVDGVKRCARCEAIHEHLRKRGFRRETWPAERLDCGESYQDHWGEAPPDHVAALAFMTQSEAQASLVKPADGEEREP